MCVCGPAAVFILHTCSSYARQALRKRRMSEETLSYKALEAQAIRYLLIDAPEKVLQFARAPSCGLRGLRFDVSERRAGTQMRPCPAIPQACQPPQPP
jgi:hypothetical protein